MKYGKIIESNLIVEKDCKDDFSKVVEIKGYVYISKSATLQADNLTSIGGDVDISEGATLQADNLSSIGGYVDISEGATLQADNLSSIGGYVDIREGATLQADNLTSIGGYVYISKSATLQADNLTSIGGYVDIREGANFIKNKNLKIKDNNCPAFKTKVFCFKFNFECFLKLNFLFADGILAKIISKKKTRQNTVYKIKIIGQTKTSYCIQIDNGKDELPTFSHGATIKEAKESLIYKISNRDTSVYKSLKLDDSVTFEEAIKMYRVITGACEFGTRNFVSTLAKKKNKYKISEIIEITKGQFGNETFKEFFN